MGAKGASVSCQSMHALFEVGQLRHLTGTRPSVIQLMKTRWRHMQQKMLCARHPSLGPRPFIYSLSAHERYFSQLPFIAFVSFYLKRRCVMKPLHSCVSEEEALRNTTD